MPEMPVPPDWPDDDDESWFSGNGEPPLGEPRLPAGEEARRAFHHEAGHALMAWLIFGRPASDLVEYIAVPVTGAGTTKFVDNCEAKLLPAERAAVYLAGVLSEPGRTASWESDFLSVETEFETPMGYGPPEGGTDWAVIEQIAHACCIGIEPLVLEALRIGHTHHAELLRYQPAVVALLDDSELLPGDVFHALVA